MTGTCYIFMPPLKTVTGGMNVLIQIASHLHKASYPVFLVSNGEISEDLLVRSPVSFLRLDKVVFHKEDRWIVPEGWPAFLAPGLKAQSACAVYVQNWAFLHGLLPENTQWNNLPIRMFSVSEPVSIFIKDTTGLEAPIVRPAIDPAIFYPGDKLLPSSITDVKIAWMPRKNKHLSQQIRKIFDTRILQICGDEPRWIVIDKLSPMEVANTMRDAHIFLSTGFPEGFGLPPLEAMACGCLVVGFTGMGGWDYMRQGIPGGWLPPFGLRHVPWGPNGFFAADGDVWGTSEALVLACKNILSNSIGELQKSGYEAAASYSLDRQKSELLRLWEDKTFWD